MSTAISDLKSLGLAPIWISAAIMGYSYGFYNEVPLPASHAITKTISQAQSDVARAIDEKSLSIEDSFKFLGLGQRIMADDPWFDLAEEIFLADRHYGEMRLTATVRFSDVDPEPFNLDYGFVQDAMFDEF